MDGIEKIADEINKKIDLNLQEVFKKADKTELETLKKEVESLSKAGDIQGLASKFDELDVIVKRLQDSQMALMTPKSFKEALFNELKNNSEKLKSLKTNPSGSITLKVAGAMTFATNTTGNVGRVERDNTIYRPLEQQSVLSYFNVSNTNASIFEWVEKTGKDGGVAMVAEGAVKPQGDFDIQLFSQKPKKEALIVTISKEMLDDIEGMTAEVNYHLDNELRNFYETALFTGDGTGNNISGILDNATPFTAGSFAGTVLNPQNADVLRIAMNQVALNNDIADLIFMHPSDITMMDLEKQTNGAYSIPPFVSADGLRIKGAMVIPTLRLGVGEALVLNSQKYRVKVRENLTYEIGYRGASGDWEKNMISFLGEMRFFGFIPSIYYGSVVFIADLDASKLLIEKP